MITLAVGNTVQGVASAATTITYTLLGMEKTISTGLESFKVLAQGQLAAAVGALYTVGADTAALVKSVRLANTLAVAVGGIKLYINGAVAANQITGSVTIPANGFAVLDQDGWHTYDAYGRLMVYQSASVWPSFNVKDFGATGDGATNDTTAIQACMTAAAAGGAVFFPAGTYLVNATIVLPANNFTIFGEGKGKSIISSMVAFVAGDVFQCQSGGDQGNIRDLGFTSQSATARTSGATININGCHDVHISDVYILYPYIGIAVQGSAYKCYIDHFDIKVPTAMATSANSAGILVNNIAVGDTRIQHGNIESASGAGRCAHGIRIQTTGYVSMLDVSCTAMDSGFTVNPGAGTEVAINIFATNCLFDTCQTFGVNFTTTLAANRIRQVRFTDCWFSGTVAGPGFTFNPTAGVMDDISLDSCRILSNNTHGVVFLGAAASLTNISVTHCDIGGNSTVGSGTADGILLLATQGGFFIHGNKIGSMDTFPANQRYGVNLPAGTSLGSYVISANDLRGNVTGPMADLATVTPPIQRRVENNIGGLLGGAVATLAAPVTSTAATDTAMLVARILKTSVKVGDTFRISMQGISTSTGTLIFRVHVGAAGTVADTTAWISLTSAAQVANQRAGFEGLLVVRSIGAGTIQCECLGYAQAALLPTVVAALATTSVTTTADWYITLSVLASAGTYIAEEAAVVMQ